MKSAKIICSTFLFCFGCAAEVGDVESENIDEALVDRSATPAVRPTYREVSIKTAAGYFYQWFRGRTATQVQRDAMEETLHGIYVFEALRYARTMDNCKSAVDFGLSQINVVNVRLGPIYEQNSLQGNDSWAVTIQGRHYSIEQYILERIRDCSIASSAKVACAQNPLMTPDMADLLDLRVENGECVEEANFSLPEPVEEYDPNRAMVGKIQVKTPVTPPDATLLHATHAAHAASSNARCEPTTQVLASVKAAHMALESSAQNEEQHHFFRMKDFSGFVDAGWSAADVCKLAMIQDEAHGRWADAVAKSDWFGARQADSDHQLAHICMNYKDPRLLVRMSCGRDVRVNDCPIMSCDALLAQMP